MRAQRRGWFAGLAGAVAAATLLAACSAGSGTGASDPADGVSPVAGSESDQPGASSSAEGGGAGFVADPAHAVAEPGPLKQSLLGPDLLVYSSTTLDEAALAAIAKVKGVEAVEPLATAQVQVQDTALNVVAVDPATYRRFTPPESAQTDDVWDRVAGGEIAILPSMKKKLPIDKQGYLQLGNTTGSPRLHVGAYAPQIPNVDAVVNSAWIDDLQMQPGNAALVSTGLTSPQSVRPALQKIVGKQVALQILGPDLPIGQVQTVVPVGTVAQAIGVFRYTPLGGGRVAPDPAWVKAHITTEQVPILGAVTCNRALFPQLRAALTEVQKTGLAAEIHPGEYAGCYYPRFIAGTTKLSNHSFGLALDINVPGNQRGTVGEMNRAVVAIFKKWGFAWGGDWQYTDPMHFEMAQIVNPG